MTAKKIQDNTEVTEVKEAPENNDCFIIMPIADHPDYKQGHFKRVYEDIIKPACQAAGYRAVRADDVAQTNLIHLDILQKLLESPMAICDLSTRNPNVLFELGLRQAFDKPTILIQEVGTPQIFDINLFRYTQYHNGLDYRDVLADQKAIQKVIEETKQAVAENKSVNSIIKLLSITNPATLQDSSNFGDKEYFQVLMSEISGIKEYVKESSERKFLKPRTLINNEPTLKEEYLHIVIDYKTPQMNIESFITYLSSINYIYDLSRLSTPSNISLTFRTNNSLFGISELKDLADQHNITYTRLNKDEIPF
ncbi:hypothetical protein F937_00032 [Acinetobacter calcoaceticus ANC 3680]|uniref:hypothetical protein n=1 Tax=Acinetobacter calcoaceticus TaxID=471 RepID=UPI0002CFE0A3|nr:hypothetical protein [Acinetobacter calcoaceticus]ENV96332.1 hypothetical protein F937_00032 [Acinetobacter calcoaceticus ANC 3680]